MSESVIHIYSTILSYLPPRNAISTGTTVAVA